VSSVGSFFSYVNDARSHEPEAIPVFRPNRFRETLSIYGHVMPMEKCPPSTESDKILSVFKEHSQYFEKRLLSL